MRTNPEENDIVAGYEHISRIEIFQLLRLFRPAQGGEGPQSRTENQVSSVSSSCVKCVPPHFGQTVGIGFALPRFRRRNPGSNKPESGVPTTAVWKYTSP